MKIILVVLLASALGGCAFLAAGFGGAVLENGHIQYCQQHPTASDCQ